MKKTVKKILLLALLFNSFGTSYGKLAQGDTYMLSGAAVGIGAAVLGANIPVSTGLGLFVTYLYLNKLGKPTVDDILEDTGVEIIDDKQGASVVLPVDMAFRGPITNPVIDVRYYPILNRIVEILELCDPVSIKVTGHTDKIMDPSNNFISSDKYAWAVTNYLLGVGVSPKRIIAVEGKADLEPIMVKNTPKARKLNRRVEITLLLNKKMDFTGSKFASFRAWAKKQK